MGMFRGTGRLRGNVRLTASVANGNGNGGEPTVLTFDNLVSLSGVVNSSHALVNGDLYTWGFTTDDDLLTPTLQTQVGLPSFSYLETIGFNWQALTAGGERWNRPYFDSTWTQVSEAYLWKSLASSADGLSMGVQTDGTLWATDGTDMNGASGIEGDYFGGTVQVGTATDWREIALGSFNSFAIKNDGRLFAAGQDYAGYGQPHAQVGSASDWKKVSVGLASDVVHQLALKTDGSLWTWGGNDKGQLGNGNTNTVSEPTQILAGQSWKSVAASAYSSFAVRADGTLWSWGDNTIGTPDQTTVYGLLGTGDTTTQSISTPTQVGTINDWAAVFAGNNYVAAVRADGSLYAWGFNSNGALGVGDKDVRNVPTLIAGFSLLST